MTLHRICLCVGRLAVVSLGLLMMPQPPSVAAPVSVSWSEPVNISDSPTSSIHPAIVTDGYGHVHVFWSEDVGGRRIDANELPEPPSAIGYRRWDGQAWTEPLDIIAVADDPLADFVAATVDDENRLHLVWTGLTRLYYSSGAAEEASAARAWAQPDVISYDSARSRWESDIVVDAQGTVHIVYAAGGADPGVFHVSASRDANRWSLPYRLANALREGEVVFRDVRLALDDSDGLHAVWTTANRNGYGQAVYYARSGEAAHGWDAPTRIADATITTGFTGFPYVLSCGSGELILIHVDQGNRGRVERTSADRGKTWSAPRMILSSMEGVNGFLIPLLDGREDLHLVINMRPSADQRTGIYHAPRAALDWTPIGPVAVDVPYGPSAHYADAAVRLGNEIHVVWTQLAGGEIWHVRGIIDDVDPMPAQTVPPVARRTQRHTESPVKAGTDVSRSAGAVLSAPRVRTESAGRPWKPVVGAVASALLVVGVTVWKVRRR